MFFGDLAGDPVGTDLTSSDEVNDLVAQFVPVGFDRHWPVAQHLDHRYLDGGKAELSPARRARAEPHTRHRCRHATGNSDFWSTRDLRGESKPSGSFDAGRPCARPSYFKRDVLWRRSGDTQPGFWSFPIEALANPTDLAPTSKPRQFGLHSTGWTRNTPCMKERAIRQRAKR